VSDAEARPGFTVTLTPRTYAEVMPRPSLPQSIALLVAVSVVAGVLMAGMLLPFVGGIGLATRSATHNYENLPADIEAKPLPQVSHLVTAKGKPFATFYDQDRVIEPLSKIPLTMQRALIDTEDVRFYEHGGIDFKGTLRALLRNGASGSVAQGGSTLTQQYIKNLLIENARTKKQREAAIADTLARKIREAKLAIGLEKRLTQSLGSEQAAKDQILDRYLNIAYFGDGAYGVGAAARHFFSEPVTSLNLDQSALLAGLVQSPEAYNPRYYPKLARERRDTVLGQMLKYGAINQTVYDRAIARPIRLQLHQQPNDCTSSRYGYFCDYVKHVFKTTPGLGLSLLRRGGLTVTTTLSPKMQRAAEEGVHSRVNSSEPVSHVIGAEALEQPGTGEIKALAVSAPYGNDAKKHENSIDYAVDTKYGGSHGFQAGSTFKLFVLTDALKQGIPLSTRIASPSTVTVSGMTNCAGQPVASWSPSNAGDGESGTFNLETGTWYSVNTFYAQLEQRTGLCGPVRLAQAMGVTQGSGAPIEQVAPFVLGAGAQTGFSPLDVAGAYATIAAHGKYCEPIAITKIVDRQGNSYPVPKPHCTQVIDPGLANTVTSILEGDLTKPGATAYGLSLSGRPSAAKTGTLDNNAGSWFAGYTPQLAAAAMVVNPRHPTRSLNYQPIGGTSYSEVYGATIAGPIWQTTMNAALSGLPVAAFSGPDSYYETGTTSPIPDVEGQNPTSAQAALRSAGFNPQLSQTTVDSTDAAGTVARTYPAAGSSASPGTTVTVYLSNGGTAPTTPPTTKQTPAHHHVGAGTHRRGPPGGATLTLPRRFRHHRPQHRHGP